MAIPGERVACFYPTPLEPDVLDESSGLEHEDLVEEIPQLKAMQSCYKATIPINRLREMVNEDNVSDNLFYRCEKCSKCQECRHTSKFRAMSVQERREQAVIEESVTLDVEQRRVTVQLPFM